MKRAIIAATGLCLAGAIACIDFDLSQQQYCESLACRQRAQICADGPQIIAQVPDKSATGVALDASVVVTFSQGVGCTDAGVTLVQYTGGEPAVPGVATCTGNNIAVFTPSVPLLSGRVYKAYVNDCLVWNDAGVGGLDASWTFTTR